MNENIFQFLTSEEEQKLLQESGVQHFAAEEQILHEGDSHNAIYVIKTGTARVEIESSGFQLEIARLAQGQIFGEMSFLEGSPASASIVADKDGLDVYAISGEQVDSLLAKDPGFFGRFYKSLADILSKRLRDTNVLMKEESWSPV